MHAAKNYLDTGYFMIALEPSWLEHLRPEFDKDYMKQLKKFLSEEKQAGKVIYPKGSQIFRAFDQTPFDQVKVVILGQDPYHGPGQAHGLCFSVEKNVPTPPSLDNIYKEITRDLGACRPKHGDLSQWAKQGVLLLNAVLTVEQNRAASHQGRGWERFTDEVIRLLAEKKDHLVFMLWGSYAQKKGACIDPKKHLVLKTSHPSPLSVYRGFSGSSHFSQANNYLRKQHQSVIDWSIHE